MTSKHCALHSLKKSTEEFSTISFPPTKFKSRFASELNTFW